MKTSFTLAVTTMIACGALAQQPATPPPAPPATAAPMPALTAPPPAPFAEKPVETAPPKPKASAPKKTAAAQPKPAKPAEPAVPLVPGPATVNASNVNVRGQAKLNSERVASVNKGDSVIVLEEIVLDKPAVGEPARWARITLPADTKVWVNATFIDATNKTVMPRRLNLRAGPGEEYSIVGLVEKGEVVHEAGAMKDHWMQIEAPKGAYAFLASRFLKQEVPAIAAAPPAAPVMTPTPAPVVEPPALATGAPLDAPPVAPVAETPAPADVPVIDPVPEPEEPLPPRIVSHEGVVRSTWSIQAPTKFALVDPDSGRTVNYLFTTATNLDLGRYKGLRIVVSGEEGLDPRWKNTPVLTIQRIQVIE
jgi:uncharacterized protein YgiM (DUF1202 family)